MHLHDPNFKIMKKKIGFVFFRKDNQYKEIHDVYDAEINYDKHTCCQIQEHFNY